MGFGEYGFPECHAASFALLVYVSAWLKRHEPAAFCCALLNSQPMGFYAPQQLVRSARDHGVEVRLRRRQSQRLGLHARARHGGQRGRTPRHEARERTGKRRGRAFARGAQRRLASRASRTWPSERGSMPRIWVPSPRQVRSARSRTIGTARAGKWPASSSPRRCSSACASPRPYRFCAGRPKARTSRPTTATSASASAGIR